jgi:hypothetical protein
LNDDTSRSISRLLVLVSLLISIPAVAFAEESCGPGPRPGATLLIPYFEVDLDDPSGRTTLISVNNADVQPVVARVTVWTNMARVTLVFDVVLQADEVRTLNLRDVLQGSFRFPAAHQQFPGCGVIPQDYEYPAAFLAKVHAWHRGQPAPGEGVCYSLPAEDPGLAVGYVTVDAMNDCNPSVSLPEGEPLDYPGPDFAAYFERGGFGLASNRNVLWGDVIYLDPGGDAAMAVSALALRADGDRFAPGDQTFYSGLGYSDAADGREPLPSTYRSRFFDGGAFGGGSELILWLDPAESPGLGGSGFPCDDPDLVALPCNFLTVRVFDEHGELHDERIVRGGQPITSRLRVGGEDLPVPVEFGYLEIHYELLELCTGVPLDFVPLQASATTVLRASGRFSAATAAVALDSNCPSREP